MTTETIQLPTFFACPLMYGDFTGCNDQDQQWINDFTKNHPGYSLVEVSEETDFRQYRNVGCEVADFIFVTP